MSLPDGPQIPALLQSLLLLNFPLWSWDRLQQKYGDTFRLGDDASPTVIFTSPEAIKTIVTASPEYICSTQDNNEIVKTLIGESSLIFLDRQQHQKIRNIVTPFCHKQQINNWGFLIQRITEGVMNQFLSGKPFSVHLAMREISIRVLTEVVFGSQNSHRCERLCYAFRSLTDLFESPLFQVTLAFPILRQDNWGVWSDYKRLQAEIDEIIETEIDERRISPESTQNDALSLLLYARDETDQPLSKELIRDQLMSLMLAGHETTASAMSWALYWIHSLPGVGQIVINEIKSTLDTKLSPSEAARLPYLKAVCLETLRFYPIGASTLLRKVLKTIEIDGFQLEPGTYIDVSIYLTHRRSSIYSEADKFKPERFLKHNYTPYEYIPFGGGDCRCLGANLALYEMNVVLATMLSQLELKLNSRFLPPAPKRHGTTMIPPKDLEMKVTRINPPG